MPALTGHTRALQASKTLCNELFAALQEAIPNLKREPNQESCGLYQDGFSRFVYVYHRSTLLQIDVWCRGDVDELKRYDKGLDVTYRPTQNPGWEMEFPAHFSIRQSEQIAAAASLLLQVSFPASKV